MRKEKNRMPEQESAEERRKRLGKNWWRFQKRGPKPLTAQRARELAAMRRTHGAGPGRPRSDKLRCFCGAMTLARAIQRAHNCEEPSLQEGI